MVKWSSNSSLYLPFQGLSLERLVEKNYLIAYQLLMYRHNC